MKLSWVTLDRMVEEKRLSDAELRRALEESGRPLRSSAATLSDEELLQKLRSLGCDLDRAGLERLCEGAHSAQEVAGPLLDRCDFRTEQEQMEGEWIWVCIVALWQRWWPEKVCLELLDDKIQDGYDELERRESEAGAGVWLSAWADVGRLCAISGIRSIREFDDRFPMTQSLFNWSQDLEDALWNAGLSDPEFLRARIAFCEDALARFPDEDQLIVEDRRRALAQSHFQLGDTDRAEAMFERWLEADPRWGWGWIGWADLHLFTHDQPRDYERAEELLRRGYSTPGVHDRQDIAERLELLYKETGRRKDAQAIARQAKHLRRRPDAMTLSRTVELQEDDDAAVGRDTATVTFGGEGLPLDRLTELMAALQASKQPTRAAKVGRNAPCPCGSGRKFKKCCG
jgi:tetratricopeptide (TPR) repeat protein